MAKVADAVQVLKFPPDAVITKGTVGEEFFMIQRARRRQNIGETPEGEVELDDTRTEAACRARTGRPSDVTLQRATTLSARDGRAAPADVRQGDLTVLRIHGRFRAHPSTAEGIARA